MRGASKVSVWSVMSDLHHAFGHHALLSGKQWMHLWVRANRCFFWAHIHLSCCQHLPFPFPGPSYGCNVKPSCQEHDSIQVLLWASRWCASFFCWWCTVSMICLVPVLCWALSVEIFHFCSELLSNRRWRSNPVQGCFDKCNVDVTNSHLIAQWHTGALSLQPRNHNISLEQIK